MVRRFAAMAFVLIALALGAIVLAADRFAESAVVRAGTHSAEVVAQAFTNSVWPQIRGDVLGQVGSSAETLRTRPQTRTIDEFLRGFLAGTGLLKVKLYDLRGRAIYSSEFAEIGQDKTAQAPYENARLGMVGSALVFRELMNGYDGPRRNVYVLGTYVPIKAADGAIEGVLEFYADQTEVVAESRERLAVLAAALAPILLALYAALCVFVWRSDRVQRRQTAELAALAEQRRASHIRGKTQMPHRHRIARGGVRGQQRSDGVPAKVKGAPWWVPAGFPPSSACPAGGQQGWLVLRRGRGAQPAKNGRCPSPRQYSTAAVFHPQGPIFALAKQFMSFLGP